MASVDAARSTGGPRTDVRVWETPEWRGRAGEDTSSGGVVQCWCREDVSPLVESDWRMSSLQPNDFSPRRRTRRMERSVPPRSAADSEMAIKSPPLWRWLTMMAVMFVALVLIEYQIHPAVPVVLLCFKLCFRDVLDALWLARRDPNPKRGRIVALWYLTRAMWHVGAWAFLLMLLSYIGTRVFAGADLLGPAPGRNAVAIDSMGAALIATSLAMFVAAFGMTWGVVIWTTVTRQPVWLGKDVSRWRQRDRFPPFVGEPQVSPNDTPSLTTIVTFTAGGAAAAIVIRGMVQVFFTIPRGNAGDALVDVTIAVIGLVTPIAVLIGTMRRGEEITGVCVAETPEACWTDS